MDIFYIRIPLFRQKKNAHVRAFIIYHFLVFLFVRKFESVSFAFVFDLQRETQ